MAAKRSNPDKPWETTKLWKLLHDRIAGRTMDSEIAKETAAFLSQHLPAAHIILSKGGSLPNYTLHDDGHALRVAIRMGEIISTAAAKKLSSCEIALLLLAAWLHDIGMIPVVAKLNEYKAYLEHADAPVSEDEKLQFRKFLDEERPDLPHPFKPASPADYALVDALISQFARNHHNAWSTIWTFAHFGPANTLPGGCVFLDDLTTLCESHHWPIHQVRDSHLLNAKLVGYPPQPLDVRYLACVLRTADILENDPERSPPLLIPHRNVVRSSLLFWKRDHYLKIDPLLPGRVLLKFRAQEALIEKALHDLRRDINHELEGCYQIAQAGLFDLVPGTRRALKWHLPQRSQFENPGDKPYLYIDGTFPLGGEPMHEPLERLHSTAAERDLTKNVTVPDEGQPGVF